MELHISAYGMQYYFLQVFRTKILTFINLCYTFTKHGRGHIMTVEIKHNQSFWEQGPQNAEEIHAVQQLQTGLYNIRSDTHIGITWEENERDAVFVLYMLEGEMQFQSSSEVFS